jgi:hypothetical protein
MKRIFIVGCPRSGTTLIQSMLAMHPNLTSFTENHFFYNGFIKIPLGKIGEPCRYLTRPEVKLWFKQFISVNFTAEKIQAGLKTFPEYNPANSPLLYGKAFIRFLDSVSEEQNKSGWVEKSPYHVYNIDLINEIDENCKFIHVIRNGMENASSIQRISKQYPEWNFFNKKSASQMWNEFLLQSLSWKGVENHYFLAYEKLIEQPEKELMGICDFFRIKWDKQMLEYKKIAGKLIKANEPWRENNKKDLQKINRVKELTPQEYQQIKKCLIQGLYELAVKD